LRSKMNWAICCVLGFQSVVVTHDQRIEWLVASDKIWGNCVLFSNCVKNLSKVKSVFHNLFDEFAPSWQILTKEGRKVGSSFYSWLKKQLCKRHWAPSFIYLSFKESVTL
jgi:hypothetical protein